MIKHKGEKEDDRDGRVNIINPVPTEFFGDANFCRKRHCENWRNLQFNNRLQ